MPHRETIITGLDIGSFSVKYAELAFIKEGEYTLRKFGVRRLMESGEGNLQEELHSIADEMPEKNVNISVSGPSVVVRYITLPKMKQEELASSMQFEAEKYIPFNINEIIMDHQILDPDAAGKMRVLLVAAKKDFVDSRIKLLKNAGMEIDVIDIDSFALINAFCLNNPAEDPNKIRGLVNIGERLTSVDVIRGNISYFSRNFLIGGRELNRAIAGKLDIDNFAAQDLKHHPGERLAEINQICTPVLTSMADEIRLSLNYYENQFGSGVEAIYLSGGASNQAGLVGFFTENLGIECKQWDPTEKLTVDPSIPKEELEGLKHELPIAIGLALRT